jgi:hypothetical protein
MKRIYVYFCFFFTGSLLPFMIVEYYFQDYFTFELIAIIAGVILTLCMSMKYLRKKIMRMLYVRNEKIDYFYWTQKKEEAGRALLY